MCVAYRKDSEDERILALVDRLCPDGGKTEGKPDVPRPASRMAAVGPWSPAGVLAACAAAWRLLVKFHCARLRVRADDAIDCTTMSESQFAYIVCSILCFVPAIVFHEVMHGFAAYRLGDPTAKRQGRLSLNPLKHIDPFGTVILPLCMMLMNGPVFGYAKPVPYNPSYFKDPKKGDVIVGLAGPAANLALAFVGAMVAWILYAPAHTLVLESQLFNYFYLLFLPMFVLINLYLMFFNLLPIPPLDGSSIFALVLPKKYLPQYYKIQQYAFPIFLIVIVVVPYVFHFNPVSIYLNWDGRQRRQPSVPIQHRIGRRRVVQGSHRQLRGAVRPASVPGQPPEGGHRRHLHHPDRRPVPGRGHAHAEPRFGRGERLSAGGLHAAGDQGRKPRRRASATRVDDDIAELAPSEARDILVDRLLTYKQYKNAATALLARFERGRAHARPPVRPGRVLPEPHARLPEGRHAGRARAGCAPAPWRAATCSCWNRSTSPPSPSPWRRTCAPSTSASRTRST